MKSYSILCIFIILSFKLLSQNYIPYYKLVNEAEFKVYNKQYKEALSLINNAFKLEEPLAKDYFLKAICLDKLITIKHTQKKIAECLKNAALRNGRPIYWISKNPLDIKIDTNLIFELKAIEANQNLKTKANYSDIEYFLANDQRYRKIFTDSIMVYFNKEDIEYINYSKFVEKQDSINQTEFLDYIKQYNYPGIRKTGTNLSSTILIHLNCIFLDEYKHTLSEQLKKGYIHPFYYAQMVDRISCLCNNESSYYTYTIGKSVEKKCLNIDKNQIIKNRLSIGLSPYFKHSGILRIAINQQKLISYP